jgi:hypothetical protein
MKHLMSYNARICMRLDKKRRREGVEGGCVHLVQPVFFVDAVIPIGAADRTEVSLRTAILAPGL